MHLHTKVYNNYLKRYERRIASYFILILQSTVMSRIGLALDIDGVLLRGSKVLDITPAALKRINEKKIPHIFMTNGGSMTEQKKAEDLTKKFGVPVSPEQVLLSHTPMKKLAEKYGDKKVLVLGANNYLEVAAAYGFKNVVTGAEIHAMTPSVFPSKPPASRAGGSLQTATTASTTKASAVDDDSDACSRNTSDDSAKGADDEPIAAALILYEPLDWALKMQVLTDVLLGSSLGTPNLRQMVPCYACNPDIVYQDVHPHPRFTQGAFVAAFRGLFEHYTQSPLTVEFCGKPFEVQYRTAEQMIHAHAAVLDHQKRQEEQEKQEKELQPEEGSKVGPAIPTPAMATPITQFYGIGDNPKADIRGANNAGPHWSSVLVRTGVFQGADNDPEDIADHVTDTLATALDIIFEKHSI